MANPQKGMTPKQLAARRARPNKINAWFRAYTDESNPKTFLNASASARAAKYKAKSDESFRQIGCQNFTKLNSQLNQWFDEVGLSDAKLKAKLDYLVNAKKTLFFQKDGKVTDQREVEALDIQLKSVELAGKWRGLDKTQPGGGVTINIFAPSIGKGKVAGIGVGQAGVLDVDETCKPNKIKGLIER